MDNSVNFNGMATDHTEDEIGVYDENSISISSKFLMFGYPAKMRIGNESADAFVELFSEGDRPGRTIAYDPVKDRDQVVLGNRKIANRVLISHGHVALIFASSEYE